MRFSIRINNDRSARETLQLAQAAEAAGFDQFWVSNDLFLRSAPVLLGAIAKETSRIHIGSGILNPYSVHVSEIAMMAATLQELSGGRFLLGLGAGAADFLEWIGMEQKRPLAAARDAMDQLRGLFAGEHTPAMAKWTEGAYLRFESAPPPIYVGAMGPRMLELTGELADGALPLLFPPSAYTWVSERIEVGRRRSRVPRDFDLAACLWVSIDRDEEQARRHLAEKVAYYGHSFGDEVLARLDVERSELEPMFRAAHKGGNLERATQLVPERLLGVGIVGDPKSVRAQLGPLVEAGATHLSFGPPLGPDPQKAIELLGAEVLPNLVEPS